MNPQVRRHAISFEAVQVGAVKCVIVRAHIWRFGVEVSGGSPRHAQVSDHPRQSGTCWHLQGGVTGLLVWSGRTATVGPRLPN